MKTNRKRSTGMVLIAEKSTDGSDGFEMTIDRRDGSMRTLIRSFPEEVSRLKRPPVSAIDAVCLSLPLALQRRVLKA
ncbi:hypothetical protein Acr_24g0017390 [Actinidia rufa]|uniref:Uncharacterized protein n=1 Tax=Actinidia rufa TaxID=165716 RepID=A0A7J0GXJ6_9ERIC|nr:hypothetical protein Acr_24g0017390 [Actinidia rufa]